jgi:tRNA uridine 5-carboxymethylaminomethyl modification enzyme
MFISAEYRTLLRQDNADFRLMGYDIGLASEKRLRRMEHKLNESEKDGSLKRDVSVAEANPILESKGTATISQGQNV